jgi:hypothetical protein
MTTDERINQKTFGNLKHLSRNFSWSMGCSAACVSDAALSLVVEESFAGLLLTLLLVSDIALRKELECHGR